MKTKQLSAPQLAIFARASESKSGRVIVAMYGDLSLDSARALCRAGYLECIGATAFQVGVGKTVAYRATRAAREIIAIGRMLQPFHRS